MSSLIQAIGNLNESLAMELVRQRLQAGDKPLDIVEECRNGMKAVGERYARGEYFLGDLVLSAEIFYEIMQLLTPGISAEDKQKVKGKIVFGTVEGDIHDIGKNITIALLRCYGFEVYDLGVNVPPEKFVSLLKETDANILCLSLLLSSCLDSMHRTVEQVRFFDTRGKVKILIGGLVNERICEYIGADNWVTDARKGVTICQQWVGVS